MMVEIATNVESWWTAQAHPNLAVIKYMGKSDSKVNRPTNSSLSLVLKNFKTIVEISLQESNELVLF